MKTFQSRAAGGACAWCGRRVGARVTARSGFTLIELLVVIAIISLLIAITLPGLFNARRLSMQTQNITNLKQFATAAGTYGADFQDRIWSFSWRAESPISSQVPILVPVSFDNDVDAAKWQAINIIRRRASQPLFPDQGAWIPHVLYAHLVLQDYLQVRLPEPMVRSPFDVLRKRWAEAVGQMSLGDLARRFNLPGDPANTAQRWAFSSSYQQVPACYTPDIQIQNVYLREGDTEGTYEVFDRVSPNYRFGDRRFHEVRFPSQKVMVMESVARHYGRTPYFFTHHEARTTNAIFDGSVRVINRNDINRGGYVIRAGLNVVSYRAGITYRAVPSIGLDPWPDSSPWSDLDGYQRWCLGGLRGIDFGGGEAFPSASRGGP